MVVKTKKVEHEVEEQLPEDLPMAPPDTQYLAERYIVEIPVNDEHFETPWKLRLYAQKVLERRLGDAVELTSLKVKKPHLLARGKARLLKRQPLAKLLVTVKF